MGLKNFVVGLGLLGALVGVIAGALFALNEELATAAVQCVEGPLSDANSTNCKDGKVLSATGADCQIANLGIFNAKYDPACTAGTPYAVPSLIPTFSGPTTEFPLLFPSRTNLAGITGAGDFTTCDTYFDATIVGVTTAVTNAGLTAGLDDFKQAVKDGYDAQIASILPTLNATLAGLIPILLAGIEAEAGVTFPANFDDIIIPPSTTAQAFLTSLAGPPTSSGVAAIVSGAINLALLDGFNASTNLIATASAGLLVGADSLFTSEGFLFIPDDGSLWVTVDSTVLCQGISSPCSFADIFASAAPLLNDASLNAALAVILGYESVPTRATLESIAGLPAPTGTPALASSFVAAMQGQIADATAVEPADIFAVQSPLTSLGAVFANGCGEACNFVDFIRNSSASATTAAQQRGLLQIVATLEQCAGFAPIASAACFNNLFLADAGQASAMKTVLGSLYGLEDQDSLTTVAQVTAALVSACKNQEQDLAAIQLAATLIPTGTGLLGAGALAAVVALALGSNKLIGVAGALVAIVGMALVLGGLLGVFFAPVYANIGGGSPEDNAIAFSLGIGFTFVALLAGAGIIGALLLLVGALLKKPEDASVAIMKP